MKHPFSLVVIAVLAISACADDTRITGRTLEPVFALNGADSPGAVYAMTNEARSVLIHCIRYSHLYGAASL